MLQELVQKITDTARSVMMEIHTAFPGKIVRIHVEQLSVDIQPVGKYKTGDGKILDYPIISDVPLVMPYSSLTEAGICIPIREGDDCLVIVSETELDDWRSGAGADAVLRYDLTSAVAIPGMLKKPNQILKNAIIKNSVIIGNEECNITVSDNLVEVNGNLKVNGVISTAGSVDIALNE